MKRTTRFLSGMIATVVGTTIVACGGMQVRTDFDPSADFSRYETFFVLEEAGDATAPGFWDERIKSAIARTLSGGTQPTRTAAATGGMAARRAVQPALS